MCNSSPAALQNLVRMASSAPYSLPTDYQQLCPRFNRQNAEVIVRWANNPELVLGMFYAFIF